MTLTIWHVIGILATLAVIVGVSIYSGRSVKSAADFDRGGSSGPWLVAGAIMGALVSGQATVGTAQLAYSYGLAAWWFTLGAGIGCLLLAVGYVVPLRHSGSTTLLGIVSQRYGKAAGYWGSVLCSLGIFISVIAQVISATALLTTIFPMGMGAAALVSVAIMTLYVVFGGVTGAGMGGVVKLFLLYLACIVGSLTVWSLSGGVTPLLGRVSDLCQAPGMDAVLGLSGGADAFHTRFLSLVARGPPGATPPPGRGPFSPRCSSRPSVSPASSSGSICGRTTSPRRRYRPWPPSGRPSPRGLRRWPPPLRLSPCLW